MKRIALVLAGVVSLAAPAHAEGTFDLSWDGCTGPITKSIVPGSVSTVYATVSGQSAGHNAYGVTLAISINCPSALLDPLTPPDAWRFDAAGCQGSISNSLLLIDRNPESALSKTCPTFNQHAEGTLQIAKVQYDPFVNNVGVELILAVSYGPGVASSDPNTRYTLGRFVIDQSHGVTGAGTPGTCGGLEIPVCIWTRDQGWNALSGTWSTWTPGVTSLRTTSATPARATTWGEIRNQYR